MQSIPSAPPLTRGGIDRDAAARIDSTALDAAWIDPDARLLTLRDGDVPMRSEALVLDPISGERSEHHWYLGRLSGAPVFAQSIGAQEIVDEGQAHDSTSVDPGIVWTPALAATTTLTAPAEAELVTMSLALHRWHSAAAFSPRDGSPTVVAHAGWARIEPATGAEHFPRTDPAVIVLVQHENMALLGSNVLWEAGRFSLLAGFIEAGESAEQAALREVEEESGVAIDGLEYLGSQPWPFPRSLMLGYRARLADGQDPAALRPDPTEIAELRWFSRAELREPSNDLLLPRAGSIARWAIDNWVAEGDA